MVYDDGMETVEQYHHQHGIELNEYSGMAANSYPGGPDSDEEKDAIHSAANEYQTDSHSRLHRGLKTRQISMIALGGALGTGLLINTGVWLQKVGPGSLLISYSLVGILCYAVMAAMGEMATWLPIPSSYTGFAHRFVDPALGFALGWNYWLKYIVTTPNNLIASALVIQSWFNDGGYYGAGTKPAIYVALFLIAVVAINYFSVEFFGEFEFWLSSIKVLIILGLIILTLVIATGGAPNHQASGFEYWHHPGAFKPYYGEGSTGQFLGFWGSLTSAVFSFLGVELVGVTVGEAQNPRKAVPRAVKLTFFRIIFFYIVLILLLGMTVPYDSPDLLASNNLGLNTVSGNASPFIVAAKIAGIGHLPSIINVCLLIFTFSAANSDLYIATRMLYSLSIEGNAPKIFSRTSSRGVPIYALGLSASFSCIAFISEKEGAFATFNYFVQLVTIFGILNWISILISHIYFVRARLAQDVSDKALAYVSPFGRNGSIVALVFASVVLFFNGWSDFSIVPDTGKIDWQDLIVDYIGVPIFLCMIFGYKLIMRSKGVKPEDADLFGGKAKIDEDEAEFVAEELRRKGGVAETKYERLYRVTLGNFF